MTDTNPHERKSIINSTEGVFSAINEIISGISIF